MRVPVFCVISIFFGLAIAVPTTSDAILSSRNAPTPVNLESENYDPYDAQAPAIKLHAATASTPPAYAQPYPYPHSAHTHAHSHAHANYQSPYPSSSNQNRAVIPRLDDYEDDNRNGNRNNLYDPFYFFGGTRRVQGHGVGSVSAAVTTLPLPGTVRTRRHSRLYVNNNRHLRNTDRSNDNTNANNNLLSEDVYFFRRKDVPAAEAGRHKDKLRIFEESPYYYRQATRHQESRYPPAPDRQDSFKFFTHDRDPVQSTRPFSNGFEGRGYPRYPPPQSNHIDYYERPRNREREPAREPLQRGTIDGWSVQVGTQLKVNDDGRARNPAQHYVRDERPGNVRGYPYHRDRQ